MNAIAKRLRRLGEIRAPHDEEQQKARPSLRRSRRVDGDALEQVTSPGSLFPRRALPGAEASPIVSCALANCIRRGTWPEADRRRRTQSRDSYR